MRNAYVRLLRADRLVGALAWSLLAFAIGEHCPAVGEEPQPIELKSVEVRLFVNEQYQLTLPQMKTLTGREETRAIAKFFPGVGTGWRSDKAAGWTRYLELVFTRKDGSQVKVLSDFTSWSEGRGDRPIGPGFEKYLWKLFEDGAKN